jgi:hypothetical protein
VPDQQRRAATLLGQGAHEGEIVADRLNVVGHDRFPEKSILTI